MKKHLLALAALATVSGVAVAQSATVYGILDTGFYTTGHAGTAAGVGQVRQSQVVSGTWLPSLWGITGSEDLGGGMKATFNLQGNLNTDVGTAGSLFDRYATVGIAGSMGQIDLGRQIDNIFLQSFLNGVVPTHTNSLAVNGLLAYSNDNGNTGTNGAFINNAVAYTSPTIGGVTLKAQYAQGEVAGHTSYNKLQNVLVTYAGNGFSLSAGHEEQKTSTGLKGLKKSLLGAKTSFAGFDFAAQYNSFKNDNTGSTRVDADGYEFGVAKKIGAATVAVNYESFKNDVANTSPKIVSLKTKYDLSKRTAIWGLVSNYNKEAAGAMAQGYAATNATAGTSSAMGYGVGVTHSF